MLKNLLFVLGALALGLSVTGGARAQVTTTTLFGQITDSKGGAVAGAEVTAMNQETSVSRSAQSNEQGEYRIEFLPIGNYSVGVTAAGFKKFVQTGVVLDVGKATRADVSLQIGDVATTISVEATLPLVDTENATIGRLVENAEVESLPIVNRNVYTLLQLTPGVQSSQNSIVLGYPEQRTLINGGVDGGAGSVSYYLDGGINMTMLRNTGNIIPNPDAIQEFNVQTNDYSAQYGRSSGGVVNVVTKSGTNTIHGSLFEFVRNNDFNASNWDSVTAPPPLHRNQFGGTVGGPIEKNKAFFFFSYQGLRQITSTFENGAIVPTTFERSGNFSQSGLATKLKDPYSNDTAANKAAFASNMIPQSLLDPTAVNIINTLIPGPVVGANQWQGAIRSPYNGNDYLGKADYELTSKQRLTLSYFHTSGTNNIVAGGFGTDGITPNSNLPWGQQQFSWSQQNVNLSDTRSISNNKINQTWLSYTRNLAGRLNLPQTSLGALGSAFTVQGTPSLPQITVTGYFTAGNSIAGPRAGTDFYSIRDVFSLTRGRHSLQFGAEESLDKDIQQTLLNNYGVFSFTGKGPQSTGNALADFELGLPGSISQDAPVTAYDNSWVTGLFVQDDFRALPRLTLNLGLRWDVQTPPTDALNRESTFVAGVQSTVNPAAPTGELFPDDPGVTRGTVPVRWKHVSPRIGLAWDPFGNGKTSIRAGAGIFYGMVSGNEWNATSNFEPFAIRLGFTNVGNPYTLSPTGAPSGGATLTNPYQNLRIGLPPNMTTGDPFPYSGQFIAGASIEGVAPNFQWPYTYQFNLSVQRQLTKDFSLSVAYVGALSHDLPLAADVNYPISVPGVTPTTGNVKLRRPVDNPNVGTASSPFGQILLVQSNQTASYHGLQVTADKRMSNHLLFRAFYTFSKTIQSAELQNNTTNPTANGQIPQDYLNLAEDRSRADYDLTHMFVASLIWQLDYYRGRTRLLRSIANGWSISPIITIHSGLPMTIISGADNNADGITGNDRPNLVGDPNLAGPVAANPACNAPTQIHTAQAWFNPCAFVANAAGKDGNVGRNTLNGPVFRDVDLAIFRNFKIGERFTLQARGEGTNVFNMVSKGQPNFTLTSKAFGTITNAFPTRQLQLGLRLSF
jgi:hypothetical protein